MTLALVLVGVAILAIGWRLAAFVLGALGWAVLALIGLSLLAGVPVPLGAVVGAVGLWFASQVVSRTRHGAWRSRLLRGSSLPV